MHESLQYDLKTPYFSINLILMQHNSCNLTILFSLSEQKERKYGNVGVYLWGTNHISV